MQGFIIEKQRKSCGWILSPFYILLWVSTMHHISELVQLNTVGPLIWLYDHSTALPMICAR